MEITDLLKTDDAPSASSGSGSSAAEGSSSGAAADASGNAAAASETAASAAADAGAAGAGDAAAQSSITVDSVMISPVNKNIVIIVGNHRNHFVSEDAAVTFQKIKYFSLIHNFHFHPTRPTYALISTWTDSCYAKPSGSTNNGNHYNHFNGNKRGEECNHQLYYTTDLGKTFKLIAEYVVQFSWGDKNINGQDNIYFTQHRAKAGDQPRYGGWVRNKYNNIHLKENKNTYCSNTKTNNFKETHSFPP